MSFMQVKLQFSKKNITFTCITSPQDGSQVPGMQVKVMFFFENCTFTCITDTWHGSYAGKSNVFLVVISKLDLLVFNTFRMRSPSNFGSQQFTICLCQMLGVNIEPYFSIKRRVLIYFKCWESIVHPICVSNVGCQCRTLFLNQTSGANIDAAAAAASLYFG